MNESCHLQWQVILTHLPMAKMAAISQTIYSDVIVWMKSLDFDKNFTEVCS